MKAIDINMIVKSCEYWVKNHEGEDLPLSYSSVVELLNVLKEQEAVEPKKIKGFNQPLYIHFDYSCENCKTDLLKGQPFCAG